MPVRRGRFISRQVHVAKSSNRPGFTEAEHRSRTQVAGCGRSCAQADGTPDLWQRQRWHAAEAGDSLVATRRPVAPSLVWALRFEGIPVQRTVVDDPEAPLRLVDRDLQSVARAILSAGARAAAPTSLGTARVSQVGRQDQDLEVMQSGVTLRGEILAVLRVQVYSDRP